MRQMILSNPEIVREILKRIKNSKTASRLDDFKRWFPDYFENVAGSVLNHPPDDLRQLVHWGLVDAFDGPTQVSLDDINDTNIGQLSFRLAEFAIALEKVLEVSLTARSFFGPPEHDKTKQWHDVFMLMPFKRELKAIFDNHVKAVANKLQLTAGRADNEHFSSGGAIIRDIWSGIHHAKVIVADCTEQNPNVFYEIGIAHTLGKETILICQMDDRTPFDVNYLRIIFYRNTPEGLRQLETALEVRIAEGLSKQGLLATES